MSDSFIDNPRLVDWPDDEGYWWFYGYRYGKISCGTPTEKEIVLCTVWRAGDKNLMVTGAGQFVYHNEVEEPMFIPATMPVVP